MYSSQIFTIDKILELKSEVYLPIIADTYYNLYLYSS
ncbi:hypothetical protein BN1195_00958 [Chryseobacterium oranimense G311]|nr:hypothetical protein BN1195_00958 [Chryseobacterium oranimense G311]